MDRRIFRQGQFCRLTEDSYPFCAGDVVVVYKRLPSKGVKLCVSRPPNLLLPGSPHHPPNMGTVSSEKVEMLFRLVSTTLPDMTPPLSNVRWVRVGFHPKQPKTPYEATLLTEHYNPLLSLPNTVHLRDLIDQEREYREKWDLPVSPDLLPDRIEDIFR